MSSKKSNIDISVLVLCYNASKYIEECLDSIVNQNTAKKLEIVVMDDCSTDDTYDTLLQYSSSRKLHNVDFDVYKQLDNKGCYMNLLDGLNHCSGTVIAYMEADDYWIDPNKLEYQYNFLLQNSSYSGISTGCQFVDASGTEISHPYYNEVEQTEIHYVDAWVYPIFQTSTLMFWNKYPLIGRNNLEFSQCNDKILIHHLTTHQPIFYLPRKTTAYRLHRDNITAGNSKSKIYLHHLKVNWQLLKNNGGKPISTFLSAFFKLTFIWVKDLLNA